MNEILGVRMPKEAMDKLVSMAKKDNRSASGMARKIILEFLDSVHTPQDQVLQATQLH